MPPCRSAIVRLSIDDETSRDYLVGAKQSKRRKRTVKLCDFIPVRVHGPKCIGILFTSGSIRGRGTTVYIVVTADDGRTYFALKTSWQDVARTDKQADILKKLSDNTPNIVVPSKLFEAECGGMDSTLGSIWALLDDEMTTQVSMVPPVEQDVEELLSLADQPSSPLPEDDGPYRAQCTSFSSFRMQSHLRKRHSEEYECRGSSNPLQLAIILHVAAWPAMFEQWASSTFQEISERKYFALAPGSHIAKSSMLSSSRFFGNGWQIIQLGYIVRNPKVITTKVVHIRGAERHRTFFRNYGGRDKGILNNSHRIFLKCVLRTPGQSAVVVAPNVELSIKHFENAVSRCIHLPIPGCIRSQVAAIFILDNPRCPNHFLNGCYIVLRSSTELLPAPELLSLVGASLEHGLLSRLCQSALLKPHLPFRLRSRVIGWPSVHASEFAATWSSEGTSLALSFIPTRWARLLAFARCYATQFLTSSCIVDGDEYFASTYPAKANLVNHGITFAWVCGQTNTAVGYIQLTHLVDDQEQLHVLITGFGVEEAFRRRGFGRAMLLHVIASVPAKEIWVEVQEDNRPAMKLYIECGFHDASRVGKLYDDLDLRTSTPSTTPPHSLTAIHANAIIQRTLLAVSSLLSLAIEYRTVQPCLSPERQRNGERPMRWRNRQVVQLYAYEGEGTPEKLDACRKREHGQVIRGIATGPRIQSARFVRWRISLFLPPSLNGKQRSHWDFPVIRGRDEGGCAVVGID
ncbi:hypothetical protein EDC04DRAFT_2607466 [Pisolithus marmoratus]|nr:hypothetical protein EDC04DRAFT_2607466 [Pisolithus marmoratus]